LGKPGCRAKKARSGSYARRRYGNYKNGHTLCCSVPQQMVLLKLSRQRASTLIESVIAASLSAIFLGSLFTVNTSTMQAIKMARETACASQVLQQRVEGLRIANWHQVTNAEWIRTNLLNADASGSSGLKNLSETLTLIPYGSSSTSMTQLERANGSARVVVQNSSLLTEHAMKVVWTVNFTGAPNDRTSSRQTVAILAKGGVAK
jgi:type II secretory pathway pseudopilin PulG